MPMPHRDLAVEALIENAFSQLNAYGADAGATPDASAKPASAGQQAAEAEKVYEVAQTLCDEGNFLQAAPLAMSLAINSPFDPRFYFATGRAFQRLGVFNVAATFYEQSMRDGASALPTYRLAECMAGMCRAREAIALFDKAFDLGRHDAQYRALQDNALNAIERIRIQSLKKTEP
jgi:tetratricopeptide (TPR) repeat protein